MIIGVRLDHLYYCIAGVSLQAFSFRLQVEGFAWLGLARFNFVPLVTAGCSPAHSRTLNFDHAKRKMSRIVIFSVVKTAVFLLVAHIALLMC